MLFALTKQASESKQEDDLDSGDVQTTNVLDSKQSEISHGHSDIHSISSADQIEIVLGTSRKSFFISKLSQLSYFSARFSSRWASSNSNKDNCNVIEIFAANGSSQSQLNFTCNDLQLLLHCLEESKIPENLDLGLNELESLLYCNDYFNPQLKNDCKLLVIDEKVLKKYFRNRIPSLHKEKRDELLADCTHSTLRNALQQLSNEYKQARQECENSLFRKKQSDGNNYNDYSYDYIKSLLNKVELDAKTATQLFESQFQLKTKVRFESNDRFPNGIPKESLATFVSNLSQHYVLEIEIENFDKTKGNENDTPSILNDLWGLCDTGTYLSAGTFEKLDSMVEKLLDPATQDCAIVTSQIDQLIFIGEILVALMEQFVDKTILIHDPRLKNTKHIKFSSLLLADIIICARCSKIITFTDDEYLFNCAQIMTEDENEKLIACMMHLTHVYFPKCFMADSSLSDLELSKQSIHNWVKLFQNGLLGCSKQFVIREMKNWFVLLHEKPRKLIITAVKQLKKSKKYKSNQSDGDATNSEQNYFDDEMIEEIVKLNDNYEENMAQWIINNLVLTTDQCFEFGLYLSKYIVFEKKDDNQDQVEVEIPLPQMYINFMKQHCGISWKLR